MERKAARFGGSCFAFPFVRLGWEECPVQDLNLYHRFRRPGLYPIELTGRMLIVANFLMMLIQRLRFRVNGDQRLRSERLLQSVLHFVRCVMHAF